MIRRLELGGGHPRAFVLPDDDALDVDGEQFLERYQAFLDSGRLEDCPLRAGATPTVFWIGPIDRITAERLDSIAPKIRSGETFGEHVTDTIALGVSRVEGWVRVRRAADGTETEETLTFERDAKGRLPDAFLDLLLKQGDRTALYAEVGKARSLSPAHKKSNSSPVVDVRPA